MGRPDGRWTNPGRAVPLVASCLVMLLGACGEGGGESGPTPVQIRPLSEPIAPSTPPSMTTPDAEPTSEPDSTRLDDGVPAPPVLENLIGRVRFEFGFDDAAEVFELTSTFALADITLEAGGDVVTGAEAVDGAPAGEADERALLNVENGVTFVCSTYEASATARGRYLCLLLSLADGDVLDANEIVVAIFDLGLDGRGRGEMEFCESESVDEDVLIECAIGAATTPDGFVNVEVGQGAGAVARTFAPGKELIRVDAGIYLANAERSRIEPNEAIDTAASIRVGALVDAVRGMRDVVLSGAYR